MYLLIFLLESLYKSSFECFTIRCPFLYILCRVCKQSKSRKTEKNQLSLFSTLSRALKKKHINICRSCLLLLFYILHGVQKKNKNDICPPSSCADKLYFSRLKPRQYHFLKNSLKIKWFQFMAIHCGPCSLHSYKNR